MAPTHADTRSPYSARHSVRHPASPIVDLDLTTYLPYLSDQYTVVIRGCISSQSRRNISSPKSGTHVVSQPTRVQNQLTPGRQTRTSKRVRARRHGEGFHSLVIDTSCPRKRTALDHPYCSSSVNGWSMIFVFIFSNLDLRFWIWR